MKASTDLPAGDELVALLVRCPSLSPTVFRASGAMGVLRAPSDAADQLDGGLTAARDRG